MPPEPVVPPVVVPPVVVPPVVVPPGIVTETVVPPALAVTPVPFALRVNPRPVVGRPVASVDTAPVMPSVTVSVPPVRLTTLPGSSFAKFRVSSAPRLAIVPANFAASAMSSVSPVPLRFTDVPVTALPSSVSVAPLPSVKASAVETSPAISTSAFCPRTVWSKPLIVVPMSASVRWAAPLRFSVFVLSTAWTVPLSVEPASRVSVLPPAPKFTATPFAPALMVPALSTVPPRSRLTPVPPAAVAVMVPRLFTVPRPVSITPVVVPEIVAPVLLVTPPVAAWTPTPAVARMVPEFTTAPVPRFDTPCAAP